MLAPLFLAGCGGAQPAETTAAAAPPPPASATASAAASAASSTAAPKPATAAEGAAACVTTATYDKKEPNKITFKVKNTSSREVKMCWLTFYVYDAGRAQLARLALPYNYKIAPGESDGQGYEFSDLGKQVGSKSVATIETVIPSARFSDGAEFEDKTLAPEKRPRGGK
jgi:hypothetical protein